MWLIKLHSKKRNYFNFGEDHLHTPSVYLHSDTLFSAITNNIQKAFGSYAVQTWIEAIQSKEETQGGFRLSSGFHFLEIHRDGTLFQTLYFFPKPLIRLEFSTEAQQHVDDQPKLLKKVQFVSAAAIGQIQRQEPLNFSRFHILDTRYLVADQDLEALGFAELGRNPSEDTIRIFQAISHRIHLFPRATEQKVSLSRAFSDETESSIPYSWNKVFNLPSSYFFTRKGRTTEVILQPGYFFLINLPWQEDDPLWQNTKTAVQLLQDTGIGGKKSLGFGLVDAITWQSISESSLDANLGSLAVLFQQMTSENTMQYINLSLVYPESDDSLTHLDHFELLTRAGYISSPQSKLVRFRDVRVISEGSCFHEPVMGQILQVAPDYFLQTYHPVYRNGRGIYLTIPKAGGKNS